MAPLNPAQHQTTLDSHGIRLRGILDGASHEGAAGLYFERKLPVELFLHVASYCTHDLIPLTHVCVSWRRSLLSCSSLWSLQLDDHEPIELASFESVERVRAIAGRAKGSLRVLSLGANLDGERALDVMPVVATLRQIVHEIAVLDGARSLEVMSLNLRGYRDIDDMEAAYSCIVTCAQFLEFSAVNIRKLTIDTHLRKFPGGAPFFAAMPSLQELELTCGVEEPFAESRLPDWFSTSATMAETQITTSALRHLSLEGPSMMDANFPDFPHLKSLDLADAQVCNLYGLLSKCSATLETLALQLVRTNPPIQFLPAPADGSQKDLPPELSLPYLNQLTLCGHSTPFLWTAPTLTTSHFLIQALGLKKVDFGRQTSGDGEEEWEALYNLTQEGLGTFFRDSPSLQSLKLAETNVTTEMLVATLPNASRHLTRLHLGYNATDALVDRLHVLVPSLNYLNVVNEGGSQVSLPALARLASRLRNSSSAQLRRYLGAWRLTMVAEHPPSEPTVGACRSELRTLLMALSPTQVVQLTTTLTLNDPPNALTFATVKQEVISLSQAPPKAGSSAAQQGANGKQVLGRPAAPQAMVDSAKLALKKWQSRRESDWAVEWCEAQQGVELIWDGDEDDDW